MRRPLPTRSATTLSFGQGTNEGSGRAICIMFAFPRRGTHAREPPKEAFESLLCLARVCVGRVLVLYEGLFAAEHQLKSG